MQVNKLSQSDVNKQLKANQLEGYQNAVSMDKQRATQSSTTQGGIRWNVTREKNEDTKANPMMDTDHVRISSIRSLDSGDSNAMIAHSFGIKIGLDEKQEELVDKYIKYFLQAKSYNYIVAKFASLKAAFLLQVLSSLGVTIPDLQKMQKKALDGALDENEILFEENEYNAEMIALLGGSGKRVKKELQIMDEIRDQLTTQMANFGKQDHYTEEKILSVKLKVCKRIRDEFQKEKDTLEYQKNYYFMNKDLTQTRSKSLLRNHT